MQNLWENEKRRLVDIFFERLAAGKDTVSMSDIREISPPVIFSAHATNFARKLLKSENPIRLETNQRYSLINGTAEEKLSTLQDWLISETVFTNKEIYHLCNFAIKFQFETLVRPKQSILETIFFTSSPKAKEDILVIIRGYGEKRAFIRKAARALKCVDEKIISKELLRLLLNRVERDVYKSTPVSAFLKDLELLLEFVDSVTGEKQATVHFNTVRGMLAERELLDFSNGFIQDEQKKEHWTLEEVECALNRYLLVGYHDNFSLPFVQPTTQLHNLGAPIKESIPTHDEKYTFKD